MQKSKNSNAKVISMPCISTGV